MADRLSVDLEGLDDFAQRLRRVKERLDDAKQDLQGNDRELGDARVVNALEDFEEHWRDGRRKVSENAEALATMVSEAMRTYRLVDVELGRQVAGFGDEYAAQSRARPSSGVVQR